MHKSAFLAGVRLWSERLLYGVAALGGLVLFAVMLLVSAAVYYRYWLNSPIFGDVEYVQFGMGLVVTMAMPYATLKGAHIRVDILDNALGSMGRFIADLFARAVTYFVLFLLIQKTWDKALDAHEWNDVTNLVELPLWLPYGAISVCMGLFILVVAAQLVSQILRGPKGYE